MSNGHQAIETGLQIGRASSLGCRPRPVGIAHTTISPVPGTRPMDAAAQRKLPWGDVQQAGHPAISGTGDLAQLLNPLTPDWEETRGEPALWASIRAGTIG